MAFTVSGPVSRKYLDQCIATHNNISAEIEKKLKKCTIEKQELLQENKMLKQVIEDFIQENQKLKQEIESTKQFELDTILDESIDKVFEF